MLLLCSRQSGKSTTAAALALLEALLNPPAEVLLLSPSQRQSSELFRKVLDVYRGLGVPMPLTMQSTLRLQLANGSRIIALPGTEETVRGFSGVNLLVIDEAARVTDSLYYAVRPMLAVSKGRFVALSTPFGRRGWFWTEFTGTNQWERVRITAEQCPRIDQDFLDESRISMGDRWYRQEFECSFEDTIDSVFSFETVASLLSDDMEPLFGVDEL